MKKIVSLILVAMMIVGCMSMAAFAEQNVNVRTTAFGNNYDVQDMGWRWMMAACYDGLYRNVADSEGEHFILAGAESVDVSEDGTVYTYHLRQNACWSDGVPVTAKDYVYGWTRLLTPAYNYDYSSFLFGVVGAEEYYKGEGSIEDVGVVALDDYTLQITLKVADPTFESKLVATPTYPTRQDLAEAAGEAWGTDWKLCVYNGPFCMSELVEDNSMVWTKNPYYWDAENVHLDTVTWLIVPQESTAATMFENGELDQYQPTGDYAIKFAKEAAEGKYQYLVTDYPGTQGLRFNRLNNGPSGLMGNAKICKAISYAIDREEMIDAVYGAYKPAYSYVAPAITFNGTSFRSQVGEIIQEEASAYTGDYEALRALFQEGLDELGVTTPMSDITLSFLTNGSTTTAVAEREYLQQSLEEALGILDVLQDGQVHAAGGEELLHLVQNAQVIQVGVHQPADEILGGDVVSLALVHTGVLAVAPVVGNGHHHGLAQCLVELLGGGLLQRHVIGILQLGFGPLENVHAIVAHIWSPFLKAAPHCRSALPEYFGDNAVRPGE